MWRRDVEDAVTASQLDAICRHLLMTLCYLAHPVTGAIAPEDQPSLNRLADLTGRHKATICRHLPHLDGSGWVQRDVPAKRDQRRLHRRTAYTLTVPALASRTEQPGLVADGATLVAPGDGTSRSAPTGLVADGATLVAPSATDDRRRQDVRATPYDDDDLADLVRRELAALTGAAVDGDWARGVLRQLLEGRDVRRPIPYLRRALAENPRRYLPVQTPPKAPPARGEPAPLADLAPAGAARARELMRQRGTNGVDAVPNGAGSPEQDERAQETGAELGTGAGPAAPVGAAG